VRSWLLALVLLIVVGCASPDSTPEQLDSHYRSFVSVDELRDYLAWSPNRMPLIAAHRGGPLPGFPENCIETFENALTYAPCLIECDVRRSADSVLVLIHDEDLDRTTTGSGRVDEHTLAEIQALHLADDDGRRTGYTVPTLAEALSWARERVY
jgi:glycerophosphoryl diester phosphodiesterase